jgi:hypothetical protein
MNVEICIMCAAMREALSVSAVQKHYQLSVSAIYNPHRILQVLS